MEISDHTPRQDTILKMGLFLSIVMTLPCLTQANWLYLGVSSLGVSGSVNPTMCSLVPGLVYQQLRVCQDNPEAMPCVSQGAKIGIYECQTQFEFERWNCTTSGSVDTVFGHVLEKGTKETAFIYAITSAGVVHAVTSSCSAGNLTECTCDMTRQGHTSEEGWKWGGCSDNVDYGTWFARTFVDAPEKLKHAATKDVRALMNLHNNEAGRKLLSSQMTHKCRCHGVSGSCAVKTCWRKMPDFRSFGEQLKAKYRRPVQIASRSGKRLRHKDKRMRRAPIEDVDLVFVERSPNYCRKNSKTGSLGTRGRPCRRDSSGPDSCDLLCCGRGYNTEVVRFVERCNCKFIWCCEVKCQSCETMVERHTCK